MLVVAAAPIIDHPDVFSRIIKSTSVYPTHRQAECLISDEKIISKLNDYSKEVRQIYQPVWEIEVKSVSAYDG